MIRTMTHKKILVMDDEASIRKMAGRMLKHIGHSNVEFACDGAEAAAMYEKARNAGSPFDVVIMDLVIAGGVGGKEAVQLLLQIDPEAKVIMSSGSYRDSTLLDYKKHGFVGTLPKPYTIEDLSIALDKVFNSITAR